MTSSELYHVFGIEGYRTVVSSFKDGKLFLEVESKKEARCSVCNKLCVVGYGRNMREFKTCPFGNKQVIIRLCVRRLKCLSCGMVRRANIGFVNGNKRYTKRLEKYVRYLLRFATIKDVAAMVGLGWNGGAGYANINEGTLNLVNIHPTDSIKGASHMEVYGLIT